jgi:hypothetical protein
MTLDTTTPGEPRLRELPVPSRDDGHHTIHNVRVGPPDTDPAAPSHTRGIREGNRVRKAERVRGLQDTDPWSARASAERSTGINPKRRNPIDPRSPNLPPP